MNGIFAFALCDMRGADAVLFLVRDRFGAKPLFYVMDNEMVEFSARLPFDLKLRGGIKKYLLRSLLGKKMPGRISSRAKQGFSIPMRDWLRGELKYLLDEYLEEGRVRREGYFEPAPLKQLMDEHVGRRANHSHLLWSIVSFQMWKERYLP